LPPIDPFQELEEADKLWHKWSGRSSIHSRWQEAVVRSLITLKALQYRPSGGIIAAPTTSLPEQPGGVRNWDYRFCWLRDATFALNALLLAGYIDEATQWREWLLRAVAGSPQDLQILYGVTGVRRLDEYEISWLPGYQGAAPVRVGNAASKQFQLDVYGEVMDTLHLARVSGLDPEPAAWDLQVALVEFLESNWQRPDDGIWEIRGPQRHFIHSKVMAWVAFRSRHQGCRERRPGGAARALEADTRCDPRGGVRQGIRRQARLFRSVLRIVAFGCERLADGAGGFPAAR
jgi:GH15 family glucan-1,4-alpha-glucosidase